MPMIDIVHLSFVYPEAQKKALDDINLKIEEGEFILLCGPSGCGKTTLLRHLKRELWPHGRRTGAVFYDGRPLEGIGPLRSAGEIGLVMQNPESQIVADTVWQELAFGLENLGLPNGEIRRRVAEMASFFGIGGWFHRKTDTLSGGQKQMLNLASILVMQPRLLLLDEPTAMLDPVAARAFADMIVRVNRELDITVVMAAHQTDEFFHAASRVTLMEDGRIVCAAPPAALGGFLSLNPRFLGLMPAAVRIYAACEGLKADACPLTVREGRAYLEKKARPAAPAHRPPAPEPAGKPLLECRDVWYRYDRHSPDVLRGLDLRAYAGECCCLLGENGSGKSTLLSILAGLRRPDRGAVRFKGSPVSSLKDERLYRGGLALLPQDPRALFTCDSLDADLKTTGADARAVEDIAQRLSLGGLLERHPYDLSGGELKRAAIAKLLLTAPQLLLLDEPTAGLDGPAKAQLAGLFEDLRSRGFCILAVTHDIEFAAEFAQRCLLLFDGAVACEGTPREFFGGNFFYTTAANRMARGICRDAVTCEDVIGLCREV